MRQVPQIFLQESYDRNNGWAVKEVKEMLIAKGFEILEHDEDYMVDITAMKANLLWHFEVEVKHNYPFTCMEDFHFPTVSFLARKEKWKAGRGFWYVIICGETKAFVTAHSDTIYKPEYKEHLEIDSYERLGEDDFFRVPKELCLWSSINEFVKIAA